MRATLLPILLAVAAIPASAADTPPKIELREGESRSLAGFRPLCDDASVAAIADGVVTGRKAGETTCSVAWGSPLGPRQVYRIVVTPPPAKAQAGGGKAPGTPPAPAPAPAGGKAGDAGGEGGR